MAATEYSAFGSTDPVYDPGGERIRWFCPWYVNDLVAIERALDLVSDLDHAVKSTRNTLRVVSSGDLSNPVREILTGRGYRIEATMPAGDAGNRVVTYIALCRRGRRSAVGDIRSERTMLEGITARRRKGGAIIVEEFRQQGDFRVEMVRPKTLSAEDIDGLIVLHRETFPTFPYDFANKLDLMLCEPDSYLMCQVRSLKNGRIYAFSNLEINTVSLDDGSPLCLAEYDNSIRVENSPDHGKVRGLGAIVRLELARQASRRGVDLCHAESRASLAAINGNSYHLGMQFGGTLEKHLLISGPSSFNYQNHSRFESMNVWYLNRAQLAAMDNG